MNRDIFDRANNIRSKIESYKEIIKALSRPNADIDINWRGFPLFGEKKTFTHSLSNKESREMVTAIRQYFESRIAELEKEFESL